MYFHTPRNRTAMVLETPFAAELATALAAAAEAAAILLSRAGADQVREKGRADLVTAVDEASERAIRRRIDRDFPDDLFIAEEFHDEYVEGGRRWIVDPIDGTTNFVHGYPFACVSIGLVDDEGPAVGVVHAPFLGEIYHAVRGGGAFLNGERLSVSGVETLSASLLATGFPFKPGKGDPAGFMAMVTEMVLTTHGVRRAGAAALDLAFTAAGRVDGYFEVGLFPWDIAAGALLVTEAGGQITGWPGDTQAPWITGRVLASNGRLHRELDAVAWRFVHRI
ncbi:MAG: inositol monophosphatase [Gemmatimonadota bacterium]|jgi:myo-inositol-1(or 4)-monophosphatase|nr:inositol monophosphatase [Gemmatimonadota bacterium]